MDYIHAMLQDLSSALDTDSSGEESGGEEDKKEDVDEDDQAEQAKLPHYVSRFKVSGFEGFFFTAASSVRNYFCLFQCLQLDGSVVIYLVLFLE